MSNQPGNRSFLLLSLVLAAIAALLYLPALGGDFVYDARFFVLGNDYVHQPGHLWDVLTLRSMRLDVMDNNRPVYLASVILNWALCSANPFGYHLVNVFLHASVAVLLFRLCCKLAGKASLWFSFGAALLFAVHPVNCEAVSQITYRYDLIVAGLLLLALNLATVFQPVATRRNILIGAGCVACLLLAVGTKENGVAGPPLLICYWLLFRRGESRAGWMLLVTSASLLAGAFLIARFALPPRDSLVFMLKPEYAEGSFGKTLLNQPRIWTFYLRQILWPHGLCAVYGPYSIRQFGLVPGIVVTTLILCGQFLAGMRNRLFAFGALFFWLSLLPASNLVPMYCPIADRFLYVPMVGVSLMLASIPMRRGISRHVGVAFMAVAVLALSVATVRREKVWHDSLALWTDTVSKNPAAPDAMYGLGISLFHAGKLNESVAAFERASNLTEGNWPIVFVGAALALEAMGKTAQADAAFKRAVELDHLYAYPDLLVKAFILEKPDAEKLEIIAKRQ